jgi:hypothetical protein
MEPILKYTYFDTIPSELNCIIISYLQYDDFENILKSVGGTEGTGIFYNLDWGFIFSLHFNLRYRRLDVKEEYLRWLGIEKVGIVFKMSDEITRINSLHFLDLICTNIKEIPKEIKYLTNLRYLLLAGNQIKEVPLEIGNLTKLIKLTLYCNQIKEIPKEIIKKLINTEIKF